MWCERGGGLSFSLACINVKSTDTTNNKMGALKKSCVGFIGLDWTVIRNDYKSSDILGDMQMFNVMDLAKSKFETRSCEYILQIVRVHFGGVVERDNFFCFAS